MANQNKKGIAVGALLVIFGAFFLLDNLEILPYNWGRFIFKWETFLIVLGTILISSKENKGAGLILITIGTVFLVPDIFDFRIDLSTFWPVIPIIVGVIFLFRHRLDGGERHPQRGDGNDMDYVDDANIFGGGEKKITSVNFRGGKVTSIFGGGEYDLTRAKLADGISVIDVFIVFGGAEFIVPAGWSVKTSVTPIFGGFSDERKVILESEVDPDRQLIIRGTILFGGANLKSY